MHREILTTSPFLQVVPAEWLRERRWDHSVHAWLACSSDGMTIVTNALLGNAVALPNRVLAGLLATRGQQASGTRMTLTSSELNRSVALGLIVPESTGYAAHRLRNLEIEINRHCNYGCVFCPVSRKPHPRQIMAAEVYDRVLQRAIDYGITGVSLNHYSEPTLHPQLPLYVEKAAEHGLAITLFTNGSALTPTLSAALAHTPDMRVVVNVPSVDEAEYAATTGGGRLSVVITHLTRAVQEGLDLSVSINCPRADAERVWAAVQTLLRPHGIRCSVWPTDDRAGQVTGDRYCTHQRHRGRLNGCSLCLSELNVSWDGTAFLCAQDYDQAYSYGSLLAMSIEEMVSSYRYRQCRRWIFGLDSPPEEFICRRCAWTCEQVQRTLAVGAQERSIDRDHYLDLLANQPVTMF